MLRPTADMSLNPSPSMSSTCTKLQPLQPVMTTLVNELKPPLYHMRTCPAISSATTTSNLPSVALMAYNSVTTCRHMRCKSLYYLCMMGACNIMMHALGTGTSGLRA